MPKISLVDQVSNAIDPSILPDPYIFRPEALRALQATIDWLEEKGYHDACTALKEQLP
jgi:hypothetical protein